MGRIFIATETGWGQGLAQCSLVISMGSVLAGHEYPPSSYQCHSITLPSTVHLTPYGNWATHRKAQPNQSLHNVAGILLVESHTLEPYHFRTQASQPLGVCQAYNHVTSTSPVSCTDCAVDTQWTPPQGCQPSTAIHIMCRASLGGGHLPLLEVSRPPPLEISIKYHPPSLPPPLLWSQQSLAPLENF